VQVLTHPRLFVVFAATLIFSAPQEATAQTVKFNSPTTFPAGHPYVVAAGDFDGDGKIDLVAGDVTDNNLIMLLSNGDGTFKAPLTYHLADAPYYLVPSDFNRDGKLDLAIGFPGPSYGGQTSIMFGRGDGSFDQPVNSVAGGYHPLAADFNGDGSPDLVLPATGSQLQVSLNKGNGTFESAKSYSLPLPNLRVFAAGDFDGDGKMDLIGYTRSTVFTDPSAISIWPGNGDGTFRSRIDTIGHWPQGSGPYCIAVGDFDRDGKNDVVISDEYLWMFKGNGDGTFRPPASAGSAILSTTADLKMADFNGDGKLDLVSSGVFSGGFTVLLGNGDGTFQNGGILANGLTSVSVVVVDLNGDTRPDLAGNTGGQLAIALLNATPGNLDNTDYFVHQHYADFLDREPDAPGFGFWASQISSCGTDQQCLDIKRINTSGAFYLSIEFQQTSYLIERLYKTAYGDSTGNSTTGGTAHQLSVPIVRMDELMRDTRQINDSVVVLQPGWESVLENNKQAFVSQFVQRARFQSAFPLAMTPADLVEKLNQNTGMLLTGAQRASAIALFGGATNTNDSNARAQALRQVAETQQLYDAEKNRAFVLMQYIGYLRRNPNEAPDADYSGYDFWLSKLNQFNGNFVQAEMVKAFITAKEYRQRFQP